MSTRNNAIYDNPVPTDPLWSNEVRKVIVGTDGWVANTFVENNNTDNAKVTLEVNPGSSIRETDPTHFVVDKFYNLYGPPGTLGYTGVAFVKWPSGKTPAP